MAAVLGLLSLDLVVSDAMSLKDKRRIVKSFIDRVRHRGNVSIAEVGSQDVYRRTELAVAMVGSDSTYVLGALQRIASMAEVHRGMYLVSSDIEFL